MRYVILLHGLARTSFSMSLISRFLKSEGYEVINISYPSRKFSVGNLADFLHSKINHLVEQDDIEINFVTHSLGGIIVSQYLQKYKSNNLKRVVMLAPPINGSRSARYWSRFYLVRKFFGPVLQELTKSQVKEFDSRIDVGIIVGDKDTRVTFEEAKLKGAKLCAVDSGHTFIMKKRSVLSLISTFLETGKFG